MPSPHLKQVSGYADAPLYLRMTRIRKKNPVLKSDSVTVRLALEMFTMYAERYGLTPHGYPDVPGVAKPQPIEWEVSK